MRRVAAVLVAVSLVFACRDSNAPSSTPRRASVDPTQSHSPGTAGLIRVFGADTFFRSNGKPFTETRAIATHGFKAPFVLTIQNGDADGGHRVSSGAVTVDGNELLVPSDFSQQFPGIEVEIPAGDTVHLAVQLQSQPGSYLVITLEAERAATRFCPPDVGDGTSFASMPAAIAATDTGGTIVICDGTWDIASVSVPKSLTFIPEHPNMATLRAPGFSTSFIVNTFAAGGTVRYAGLKFLMHNGGISIRSNGVRDTLVVESSLFRGDGNGNGILTTFPTSTALIVRHTRFVAMTQAMSSNAGDVLVADNVVDSMAAAGITVGNTRGGRVERNRMSACGTNSCLGVFAAAGATPVEVVDNEIDNDWARNTQVGISISGNVVVRGNRITGTGGGGLPTLPASFAFRSAGISATGLSGHPSMSDNEIVNAFAGIQFSNTPTGADGTDNRINSVGFGFRLIAGVSAIVFHRNDITGFGTSIALSTVTAGNSFTCNYWGRGIGAGLVGGLDASALNPHSLVPIANQTSVVCGPAPIPTKHCPPLAPVGDAYATLNEAISAQPSGGTVLVCDGTWPTATTGAFRPVTIQAEHAGMATLTGANMLLLISITPGTVVIKDLNFVISSGFAMTMGQAGPGQAEYDQIIVENSKFTFSASFPNAIVIARSTIPGAKVTLRNNQFIGGSNAVSMQGITPPVDVIGNVFSAQGSFAVHSGTGGPYLIRDNAFSACGFGCVLGEPSVGIEVSDNTFEALVGSASQYAVSVISPALVLRNQILGIGTVANRNDPNTYGFKSAGIVTGSTLVAVGAVTVTGNTLHGVSRAIQISGPITGSDNLVDYVHTAVRYSVSSIVPFDWRRNDFTDYVVPIEATLPAFQPPAGSLTCNWWGSVTGPVAVSALVPPASYTPFSAVPIANMPSVVCP